MGEQTSTFLNGTYVPGVKPSYCDGLNMIEGKFERKYPTIQNAVDIFANKWASNLSPVLPVKNTGKANLFLDARVRMAAESLGRSGRFYGLKILELGPLEAGHTYQLEQLGAGHVLAIESNTEAFLKCLIVKEALKLRSEFICGDAIAYLNETRETFDLIFCSGILYHMSNPINLIKAICKRSQSCFVWTHYQSDEAIARNKRTPKPYRDNGFETTFYETPYPDADNGRFLGGNEPTAVWMARDEIVRAFANYGFSVANILQDHPNHPAGAAFTATFSVVDRDLSVGVE